MGPESGVRVATGHTLELPRPQGHGRDAPVRKSLLVALCFLCACGTPSDRGSSEPVPIGAVDGDSDAPTPPAVDTYQPRSADLTVRQRLRVSVTTFGDIGEVLGIRPDYVVIANIVCANRMFNCDEPEVDASSGTDCSIWIAEEWCRVNDCQIPFLGEDLTTDPCHHDASSAACDDMARPINCPALRDAGISLRLDAWPEKPRPPIFP